MLSMGLHDMVDDDSDMAEKAQSLREKAAHIRLLILDVDGVLTDGGIILDAWGRECKRFDVKDGQGLKMAMASGIRVAVVTGRSSRATARRARELGIRDLYQGVERKGDLCRRLIQEGGLTREETCAVGDDLPDLEVFREVGLRIAVADAVQEVRQAADLVTRSGGGRGAVREVCEWLLRAQGKRADLGEGPLPGD